MTGTPYRPAHATMFGPPSPALHQRRFGGCKGSGRCGKAIGSFGYLPQYPSEPSRTSID